jgi:hypothetical protein
MTMMVDTPILDGAIRSVNFFNGRLLTAKDLWRVQLAAQDSDQRLGRMMGEGIAFGLEVDSPDPSSGSPTLRAQRGLCQNRAGETLCLDATITLGLADPPPDDAATSGFAPCAPVPGGTYVAGAGVFLLTLCSAQASEGRALTSGLDETAGKCNTDAIVRAVQFRVIPLDPFLARGDFYDGSRLRNDHEIRNRVAYKCFGTARLADYDAAELSVDARTYGLLDAVRTTGALTDCDVPLAVFYRTLTGGIRFVDNWSVRRRVAAPSPAGQRAPHLGDRRMAEAEAMMLQFEAQAEALRSEQGAAASALQAETFFAALPPVACLRVGAGAFDWIRFLGRHAPAAPVNAQPAVTPLTAGMTRAVVLQALQAAAVPVVRAADPGATPTVRYRVYQVDGASDHVLLARSVFAETVARDVHFDDRVCALPGVDNVQDAIDALCARLSGCCSIVLSPAMDCQAKLSVLAAGDSAEICFQAGDYRFERPLEIAGLRHVKVHGAGLGTRLRARAAEVALVFRDCETVDVRDLHAEGGAIGWSRGQTDGIGGALTFLNCGTVTVEGVSARCIDAPRRAAACIVVRNDEARRATTSATVLGSRCAVGHAQVGILVVNAAQATIERNAVTLADDASVAAFANDPLHLSRLRRQLLSIYAQNPPDGIAPPTAAREHTGAGELLYRNIVVSFRAPNELVKVLQRIVEEQAPAVSTPTQLAAFLKRFAMDAVRAHGVVPAVRHNDLRRALRTAVERIERHALPAAQQGIVVAGAGAEDVRIRDNAISGVEQGVHVGLSTRQASDLRAGRVQISGNTLDVLVTALTSGERHAIFVGGCDSLVIQDNAGRLSQPSYQLNAAPAEPIRLWGGFGRRLLITGNHFQAFRRGIYLRPLPPVDDDNRIPWVIQHNWVEGVDSPLDTEPQNLTIAVKDPNFN